MSGDISRGFPHWCRDGHDIIGFRGDEERCPVCKAIDAKEAAERELTEAHSTFDSFAEHHAATERALLAAERERDEARTQLNALKERWDIREDE